jgi:two-component system NtrC family sensor kinase
MRGPVFARGWLSRGVQMSVRIEVMSSLGIVMTLALLVLVAAAYRNHERTLRETLGPALLAESREAARLAGSLGSDTDWWRVSAAGVGAPMAASGPAADARVLAIASAARGRGSALLDFGALWDCVVFAAAPGVQGDVMVGRLSAPHSRRLRVRPAAVFAALALADALVFGAFGFVLLQRRVVAPLEGLAALAREVGESGELVSARLDGPPEARAVAEAIADMSAALAGRAKELSDAVVELRETNLRLRQTHAGLARAERLASVGRLAAGVAHEVGNPLGAMLAFAELVSRDAGISTASRGQLERLLREGERVRRILRQLLDLARPVRMDPRPLDLEQAASDAVSLVAAQPRYGEIAFEVAAAPGLPLAIGDENATQQVLGNLLLNAAEAVRGQAAPRVRLELEAGALRRRPGDSAVTPPARALHDGVVCRVLDNGCGIADEDRERVFDPFFSTRAEGEGTGLGLPNALRMCEEQGGSLELEAPPSGFRTAFALRLPAEPAAHGSATRAVRSA